MVRACGSATVLCSQLPRQLNGAAEGEDSQLPRPSVAQTTNIDRTVEGLTVGRISQDHQYDEMDRRREYHGKKVSICFQIRMSMLLTVVAEN